MPLGHTPSLGRVIEDTFAILRICKVVVPIIELILSWPSCCSQHHRRFIHGTSSRCTTLWTWYHLFFTFLATFYTLNGWIRGWWISGEFFDVIIQTLKVWISYKLYFCFLCQVDMVEYHTKSGWKYIGCFFAFNYGKNFNQASVNFSSALVNN